MPSRSGLPKSGPAKVGVAQTAPFAFGDVVLALFPFTNQAATKQRPAIVVSSRAYAIERPDVVLMAITTQLQPSPSFGEVWLADWQGAGLIKPSAIKPIFATFEQRLVLKRLGALSPADSAALVQGLALILGPPS